MYKITQNIKQKNSWLGFKRKDITKVYEFRTYKRALIFALNEQQPFFYHYIGKVRTSRKTFAKYLTCIQYGKLSLKNPMHYTGTNNASKLDLERLYYYYVNSNNLQRIEKFIFNEKN